MIAPWHRLMRVAFVLALVFPTASEGKDRRPPFIERIATQAQVNALRAGGYVLYMRHGATDNRRPDRFPGIDLSDCRTQRPLSEGGRLVVERIGFFFRQAGVPVSEIHTSPLCRAKDTAATMFPGLTASVDNGLIYTANMTAAQKGPVLARTRELLSAPLEPGGNRVIVAHAPNLADLIGYFPREGTVVIFRPLGPQGFEYLASIPPALWPSLAESSR